MKIEDLGLRKPTLLYLKRYGIEEVSDIKGWEYVDFKKVRNLGDSRIKEILDKLSKSR